MNDNTNLLSSDLQIDTNTHGHLSETARWAKFISIAGFIFSGMIVIFALYYLTLLNKAAQYSSSRSSITTGAAFAGIFYIGIAIVWCVTSVYQYRFASKIQLSLQENSQEEFETAFRNLKIYYKISGIVTIICLALSALGLIGIMANMST